MQSGNLNQEGTHTGSLVVSLPSPYTAVHKTVTFAITVIDPCLTATIIATNYTNITTYVGSSGSSSKNFNYDSVSGSAFVTPKCGTLE
jgi:hypothetical protein